MQTLNYHEQNGNVKHFLAEALGTLSNGNRPADFVTGPGEMHMTLSALATDGTQHEIDVPEFVNHLYGMINATCERRAREELYEKLCKDDFAFKLDSLLQRQRDEMSDFLNAESNIQWRSSYE